MTFPHGDNNGQSWDIERVQCSLEQMSISTCILLDYPLSLQDCIGSTPMHATGSAATAYLRLASMIQLWGRSQALKKDAK